MSKTTCSRPKTKSCLSLIDLLRRKQAELDGQDCGRSFEGASASGFSFSPTVTVHVPRLHWEDESEEGALTGERSRAAFSSIGLEEFDELFHRENRLLRGEEQYRERETTQEEGAYGKEYRRGGALGAATVRASGVLDNFEIDGLRSNYSVQNDMDSPVTEGLLSLANPREPHVHIEPSSLVFPKQEVFQGTSQTIRVTNLDPYCNLTLRYMLR